jgi:hypothetical protein
VRRTGAAFPAGSNAGCRRIGGPNNLVEGMRQSIRLSQAADEVLRDGAMVMVLRFAPVSQRRL